MRKTYTLWLAHSTSKHAKKMWGQNLANKGQAPPIGGSWMEDYPKV